MATVTTGADIGGQKNQNKRMRMETKLILPGVFFIYEIYSFALELSKEYVPLSCFIILLLMVVCRRSVDNLELE